MTDRKCRTCRHWGEVEFLCDREGVYGDECDDYDTPAPHRMCGRILHAFAKRDGLPAAKDDAVYLMDCSGYAANIWTAPDFGCALWGANDG